MAMDYEKIRADLSRLHAARLQIKVYGADEHQFLTNPPLTEEAVRQFEVEHRIVLPSDYRGLLIHVGNGGAGPGCGLFKLGEMDSGWKHKRWKENDGFVGTLCKPFPHTATWNDVAGMPAFDESREADQEWEDAYWREMEVFDKRYWAPDQVNGAIPICHMGCAYRQWLVVTGSDAGNVWNDGRADHRGLSPLQEGNALRVSFARWYESWLNKTLSTLPGRA